MNFIYCKVKWVGITGQKLTYSCDTPRWQVMIIDEIGTVEISDIGHHFANRFNGLCEDSMTLSSGTKPLADAWSTRMVLTTRRFDCKRQPSQSRHMIPPN